MSSLAARTKRLVVSGVLMLAWPMHAWAQACPSFTVADVINDPVVQDALDQAWADSLEGTPDEHEEGGWVQQCRQPAGTGGGYSYYTQIIPWAPGDVDSMPDPGPPPQDGSCRTVASFHTHPGPANANPDVDEFANHIESDADAMTAGANGIPGIIRYGVGDDTHDFTYNYGSNGDEPREPGWYCGDKGPAAHGWGDPHIQTFDGLNYDFMGVGDFVLVRTAANDFEIQLRLSPFGQTQSASVTSGLAVRQGPARVEWQLGQPDPRINGVARPVAVGARLLLPGGSLLRRSRDGYVFLSSGGDRLDVAVMSMSLDYSLRASPRRRGATLGLFGNADGDPTNDHRAADGTQIAPTREPPNYDRPLYRVFGESWRVGAGASLFATTFAAPGGVDPKTFPVPPAITAEARARALDVCRAAGVTDADVLQACIYDVALTSDARFAASSASVDRDIRDHSLLAVDGPLAVDHELMGRLDPSQRRVTYTLSLPAGTYLLDGRGSQGTRWELWDAADRNWLAGELDMPEVARRHTLPDGRYRLVISLPSDGRAGRFRLRVRRPADPEVLPLAPGTRVEGTITDPGQVRTYRLQLEPGTWDFSPERSGALSWRLTDSSGRQLFDGNQSRFMERAGRVTVTAPGVFELSVYGEYWTGTGKYQLTATRVP